MDETHVSDSSKRRIGNWVLERQLDKGGMGIVFLAFHKTLRIPAALKILSPALGRDPKVRERFEREAQAQAQLHHPGIARVMDFLEDGSDLFIVIEYLPGGTLAEMLEKNEGPLPVAKAVSLARQALVALDHANRRGIIHRDIKPSNLMFTADGQLKVVDFGVAKMLDGRQLTSSGSPLGTPDYMSPEQIRSSQTLDHRTDVYSMGVVLYEMLAGKLPFEGDSHFDVEYAHVHNPPTPLRQHNPTVPEKLEQLTLRALEKEPDKRFSGCGELARALSPFEERPPAEETPVEEVKPFVAPVSPKTDKRWRTAFFAALVAVAVGLLCTGLLLKNQSREIARQKSSLSAATQEAANLRQELEASRKQSESLEASAQDTQDRASILDMLQRAKSWPFLIVDDFSSKNSNLSEESRDGEFMKDFQHYDQNEYHLGGTSKRSVFHQTGHTFGGSQSNFFASVSTRKIKGPTDSYCALTFKKQENGHFYNFSVNDTRFSLSVWEPYRRMIRDWTSAPQIRAGKTNRLAVLSQGGRFILLINDEVVDAFEDATISSGGVDFGIGFEQGGQTAECAFDDFEVRSPG